MTIPRLWALALVLLAGLRISLFAYNGSETWLHYTSVPDNMKSSYSGVCKRIVLSDTASDTLKNARAEFDMAIPGLLGGSALPLSDGDGAIVLAEEGSDPVASAGINYDALTDEGFIIKSAGSRTYITGKTQVGVLYGAYHFIRLMQTAKPIDELDIIENPYFPYRVLDHWYNHYGSSPDTERVYGGNRVFRMENFGNLSEEETARIVKYCRMAVSLGLNGVCPDNVNTYRGGSIGNYKCLEVSNLRTQKVFADLIGTYGLKYYLSVSYASPKLVNPKTDPLSVDGREPHVQQWWNDKVDTVRAYIKNFGGFLMKADSEGEDGPYTTLTITQSEGANPMAKALQRYGHTLIWRTFVYENQGDFVQHQTDYFKDQTWEPGVLLRMKDGPRDFQTVEPPHHLLRLAEVRKGMEFQITQEYTGQAIHLCWLVPRWKSILDYDMKVAVSEGTEGSKTYQILRGDGRFGSGGGVWGISNFSDTVNWTGQFMAQANSYGFGRLAWNPLLTESEIADEWIRCSFDNGHNPAVRNIVSDMMRRSWKTYEDYTISYSALMPALYQNSHYEIDFLNMNTIHFFTEYFMHLTSDGIGVDRTKATGNGMVDNYSSELAALFENRETCPEEYILFFHHLPWEYTMKSGMTLIQSLFYNHYRGLRQVRRFINNWELLNGSVSMDAEIHDHVLAKLNHQYTDADRWVEKFKSDFGSYYDDPLACDIAILPPDTTKATVVDTNEDVTLSARLRDQFGGELTESSQFTWELDKASATLSATEGATTTFRASKDGTYRVTLRNSQFPEMSDVLQLFAGDWEGVGVRRSGIRRAVVSPMAVRQLGAHLVITAPKASKVNIVGLQGRVVKSATVNTTGVCRCDMRNVARGMYLVQIKNGKQMVHDKFILR